MVIYLDNAATSWPKPDCVREAMVHYMTDVGASPGRSGHRLAVEAERIRFRARETLAELFGLTDPMRIIFTANATTALNVVIRGLLTPGAHAVVTSMEHNAVMRTLRALEPTGVSVSVVQCHSDGTLDPDSIDGHIRPQTRLIISIHASNACGTMMPIREIGAKARQRGIPFLVDAAQTSGCQPIDFRKDNIDLLTFTGHKALLGPAGTGGLAIGDQFDIRVLPTLICGGTGSKSEQLVHPDFLPDKYEAGTPNIVGIAGLSAGVGYVLDRGVESIREHERALTRRLIDGLHRVERVRVFGTQDANRQTAAVSFRIDGWTPSSVAHALDERFEIMCRPGLHCTPQAHRTLGTFPEGTVRLAAGVFTTDRQIDDAIEAVTTLARAEPSTKG